MPETAQGGKRGSPLCPLALLHSRHPTWAQTARSAWGFQAFQELSRVDQPSPSPGRQPPGQLASRCFSGTWTQDTVRQGLPILLFYCFLFKPKVVPAPSHPHCSSYLGWLTGSLCPWPTCTWGKGGAQPFGTAPQINSAPQPTVLKVSWG